MGNFFGALYKASPNDPRTSVLASQRDKNRDGDPERARDVPKRQSNYWLSLRMSIPTPGQFWAQFWVAQ